jgi:hypothetical protein
MADMAAVRVTVYGYVQGVFQAMYVTCVTSKRWKSRLKEKERGF